MQLENDLGHDRIRTLVMRLAIPSMVAQFVSVLYSIVDRMYIGNIAEVGELALAGVGICGPVVTLISSFSALVGFGGAPLLSIRMGEKNDRAAREVVANSFMMLAILGVTLTAVSFLLKSRLLRWFGASEIIFPYADKYYPGSGVYLCFSYGSGGRSPCHGDLSGGICGLCDQGAFGR